jgi:hypothetical protein
MTAEQAAYQLDQRLRRYSWYMSTGIGETSEGWALFVYVKTPRQPELGALKDGWMGYKVMIRSVGAVRPVSDALAH